MSKVGAVIEGKYEVARLVGEGGMGAVYEATHTVIGRKVAIKFLHSEFAENPQALQRFIQEAQIAGSLGHANICEVTDIGRTPEGEPYMIMPLLDGESLADTMNGQEGSLPTERVFDVIYQVLTALQRAHGEGIVHRDLKPENIFLTRMGDRRDFVKILDFGISKVVSGSSPAVSGLTSTGMVLGTPYYMAPEQARGAKSVDQRVDIYAVGVILYEMLTGQRPFEADSYNEIIVKIVTEPFTVPRALKPTIPIAVEEVILKAMAKDPDERFHSAREFKHALLNRARDSAMQLPGYLTRVDFTGEVDLLSASDRGLKTPAGRGRVRTVAALGGLAILGLVVGLLVWKPWRGERQSAQRHSGPAAAAVQDDRRSDPPRPDPPRPDPRKGETAPSRATIRFLGLPAGGRIVVNGTPVTGSAIDRPRDGRRLKFVATAPGGLRAEGWVTADQDRTVLLSLRRPAEPRPVARRARPMVRRGRPRARWVVRRVASMRPPPRRRVTGRAGTELDGDYGD